MTVPTAPSAAGAPAGVPDEPVDRAIVRLVLYFDVFQHPLTQAELVRLVCPDDPDLVPQALARLAARGIVERRDHWCFRPGRSAAIARRQERARHAERTWPLARLASALLARVPFVRGVLITGGMSKGSTAPGDDVDFLLLVAPGRVWTLKSLLQGARRAWPEPIRDLFCTNYLLAEDRPLVDDRNLFTAVELATAVPMYGPAGCAALLRANAWSRRFVPGMPWAEQRAAAAAPLPRSPLARGVEATIAGPGGQRIERASVAAWDRYWNRKYAWLDEATRAQRFKRREEVATNHLHDFQGYVLDEVRRRLVAVGLDEPLELARGGRPVGSA
ncbi:hypothetical protein L6R53_20990 [Myxococcota bacterium]|nr:hypothetical protein [Myxococcota bacterium]